MIAPRAGLRGTSERDPVVVLAADEGFAMPLAATVRSALDNLAANRKLRIYLLESGLAPELKERVVRSWPPGRFSVEWLTVDRAALADLPVSGHLSIAGYYRILIPRLLPRSVERTIYLDSDMIVRADLARLWDLDLDGAGAWRAQDCSAPCMDASEGLANFADAASIWAPCGRCRTIASWDSRRAPLISTRAYW